MNDIEQRATEALLQAKRASAYGPVMNLVAAHLYSYRAQQQQHEIDAYWSHNHDEISYWNNNGYEAIKDFFVMANGAEMRAKKLQLVHQYHPEIEVIPENDGMGDMVAKGAVSPYVVISEDGSSAKGVWLTPGVCSEVNKDGRPKPTYMHEKLGINAVLDDDGVWRILKLRTYVEFVTNIPPEILEQTATPRTIDVMDGRPKPGDETEFAYGKKPYSITTKAGYYPRMPEAYATWSEETAMVPLPTETL